MGIVGMAGTAALSSQWTVEVLPMTVTAARHTDLPRDLTMLGPPSRGMGVDVVTALAGDLGESSAKIRPVASGSATFLSFLNNIRTVPLLVSPILRVRIDRVATATTWSPFRSLKILTVATLTEPLSLPQGGNTVT